MRKNEKGRSMVEMLGVLAIIGVLSVGGIYGYTVAMNKYKANEIVQTASMLKIMAESKNAGTGGVAELSDLTDANIAGLVDMCSKADKTVKIKVSDGDLCDVIKQIDSTLTNCGEADVSCEA
jgi:Tfp pilus assembly protein PilE